MGVLLFVRPKFYIEVGDDVSSQILSLFQSAGYVAFDPLGNKLTNQQHAPNMFFIPQEKES